MAQVSSLNTSYRMFQGIGIVQGTRFRVTMKACGAIKKQRLSGFAASLIIWCCTSVTATTYWYPFISLSELHYRKI